MSSEGGASSFQVSMQMGAHKDGAGGGSIGLMRSLTGMDTDQSIMVNIQSEKDLKLTGFDTIEEGLAAKLFAMRGEGFFGKIFAEIFDFQNAFEGMQQSHGGGEGGGGEGGGGGSDSGSNRAFSSLPAMDSMGPMSDVNPAMLGRLTPDVSPSAGRGMGMGADMGMGG